MRKLASIQRIQTLTPIPDADAIEVATILGWHVVVKKGEFKVGDFAVYFEIDSLLPVIPQFEFLAKNGTKKTLVDGQEVEGYHLKTVRLRNQVSQGLALPLSSFADQLKIQQIWEEGIDVTETLGVVKYDPPLPANLSGIAKGNFPSFIPRTDETRIQAVPQVITRYRQLNPANGNVAKTIFYATEKLDGTSMTVYLKDGEFGVASRNLDLQDTEGNTLWQKAKELDMPNKLKEVGFNCAFQGELVGEGIQGNPLKIKGHELYIFNAYNIDEGKYLPFTIMFTLVKKLFGHDHPGIDVVPIVAAMFDRGNMYSPSDLNPRKRIADDIDKLVKYATRKSLINPDVWAEGIVIRSYNEDLRDEDLGRLSFKVVNPEYLLDHS